MVSDSREARHRGGRSAWPVLLVVVGLVLVAWVGVGWFRGTSAPSEDEGRAIAESFLVNLRGGKIDTAWNGTTAEFKSFMGLDRLRGYVKANRVLKEPCDLLRSQAVTPNGLPMVEYDFRPRSGASTIKVLLAREQSEWKVERLSVE